MCFVQTEQSCNQLTQPTKFSLTSRIRLVPEVLRAAQLGTTNKKDQQSSRNSHTGPYPETRERTTHPQTPFTYAPILITDSTEHRHPCDADSPFFLLTLNTRQATTTSNDSY
jgi:hypothetical protein